jgi:predicted nucleotidyltransferase
MDKSTNTIIKQYISAVAEEHNKIRKAYIFGSYAKQIEKKDSDIDIAIIIEDLKNEDRFDIQVQLMLLAADYDLRIEPHPISNADFNSNHPFANEIIATGIEINI